MPPAPIPVVWRMEAGTWIEYRVYRGPGRFDPATGDIAYDDSKMVPGEITRITNLPYMGLQGASTARVYSREGVAVTEVDPQLAAALAETSTGFFIGESANYGAKDQNPPEPIVTVAPVAGETFDVHSRIIRWDDVQFQFHTRYRTLETTGCTTTTLIENPDTATQAAYVQRFCSGDLVEQWYGPVKPDNSVDTTLLRMVRARRN